MIFKFKNLEVSDYFDKDDELEIALEDEDSHYVWLPREEAVLLRDHLNEVLGVAKP